MYLLLIALVILMHPSSRIVTLYDFLIFIIQKNDIFIRKVLQSEIVFLSDDAQYVVRDISEFLKYLDEPNTPVVSLRPPLVVAF